jgi:diacylglycerol kinase (ATP)
MVRVLMVSNAASGGADDEVLDGVRKELQTLGEVEHLQAGSKESFESDVRAGARPRDTVVVAGGDGTLNCVVNALADSLSEYTFAVVPMGTGNDFARTLGMPADPVEGAAAIGKGRETEVDYGIASGAGVERVFMNACMGGFPIEVDKAIEGTIKKRFGPLAFWVGGIKAATDFSRFDVNVSGTRVADCVAVGIGNGRTAGGGIEVWPGADPADGALDVCVITASNIAQALRAATKARSGEHVKLENVHEYRGSEFSVDSESGLEFNVDGEVLGLETPATFSVGGKIKVRIPA